MPTNFYTLIAWIFGFVAAVFAAWKMYKEHEANSVEKQKLKSDEAIRVQEIKSKEGVLNALQVVALYEKMGKVENEIMEIKLSDKYSEEKFEDLKETLDSLHDTLEQFKSTFTNYFVDRAKVFDLPLKSA